MSVVPRYEYYSDASDTGLVVPLRGRVELEKCAEAQSVRHSRLHLAQRDGVDRVFVEHPLYTRRCPKAGNQGKPSTVVYPYHPMAAGLEFQVGCSILCQSAIHAPLLLWKPREEKQDLAPGLMDGVEGLEIGEESSRNGIIFICNDWPCGLLPLWMKYYRSQLTSGENRWMERCKGRDFEEFWDNSNLLYTWMDDMKAIEKGSSIDASFERAPSLTAVAQEAVQNGEVERAQDHASPGLRSNGSSRSHQSKKAPNGEDRWSAEEVGVLSQSRSVFLIHNAEFTGPKLLPSLEDLKLTDELAPHLPPSAVGGWNWLETGLIMSEAVVTVSPGYASELQSKFSSGHSKLLQDLQITGIMNGIDTRVWTPYKDPFLSPSLHYSAYDLPHAKNRAKLHLQWKVGLDRNAKSPVFGFIGRLDQQKGVDILLTAILLFFTESQDHQAQFVLLGCGDAFLEEHLRAIQYWFPGQAMGVTSFNDTLSHEILAGCDFLLIPSRFEPCGLVALSAVRYCTLPIAPSVGGLKEIVNVDRFGLPPLGIEIERDLLQEHPLHADASALYTAMCKAIDLFGKEEVRKLQRRCMFSDVSWDRPVLEWQTLLQSLVQNK